MDRTDSRHDSQIPRLLILAFLFFYSFSLPAQSTFKSYADPWLFTEFGLELEDSAVFRAGASFVSGFSSAAANPRPLMYLDETQYAGLRLFGAYVINEHWELVFQSQNYRRGNLPGYFYLSENALQGINHHSGGVLHRGYVGKLELDIFGELGFITTGRDFFNRSIDGLSLGGGLEATFKIELDGQWELLPFYRLSLQRRRPQVNEFDIEYRFVDFTESFGGLRLRGKAVLLELAAVRKTFYLNVLATGSNGSPVSTAYNQLNLVYPGAQVTLRYRLPYAAVRGRFPWSNKQ